MKIQPIQISNPQPAKIFSLKTLAENHSTQDDPAKKVLQIILREALPPQTLVVVGAEYDALGQWTDATLNQYIIGKLGLVIVPDAPAPAAPTPQ